MKKRAKKKLVLAKETLLGLMTSHIQGGGTGNTCVVRSLSEILCVRYT